MPTTYKPKPENDPKPQPQEAPVRFTDWAAI